MSSKRKLRDTSIDEESRSENENRKEEAEGRDAETETGEDYLDAEGINSEIMSHLEDLDDIRARCKGKLNGQIKISVELIREKTEDLTELAVNKEAEIEMMKREIETLRESLVKLRKEHAELAKANEENGERQVQKKLLAEIRNLREELKTGKEISIGKGKETEVGSSRQKGKLGPDGNWKENTDETSDRRILDKDRIVKENKKAYADMAGRNGNGNGNRNRNTGKRTGSKTVEGSMEKEKEEKIDVVRIRSQVELPTLVGKIRKEVDPGKNGVAVVSAKKDEQGNLMIRIQGKQEDKIRYREELKKCIGEKDRLEKVQKMVYIHISNLDMITTVEEIEGKVCMEGKIPREEVKVTSLRPAFGETKKATVQIPQDVAKKLVRIGKIRIGMIACKINIRNFETRCFKCGETGHISYGCEETWNIGRCFRCGKQGHLARDCEEDRWKDARQGPEKDREKDRVTGTKKQSAGKEKTRK